MSVVARVRKKLARIVRENAKPENLKQSRRALSSFVLYKPDWIDGLVRQTAMVGE